MPERFRGELLTIQIQLSFPPLHKIVHVCSYCTFALFNIGYNMSSEAYLTVHSSYVFVGYWRLHQTCDPAAELLMKVLFGCEIQKVDTCLHCVTTNKQQCFSHLYNFSYSFSLVCMVKHLQYGTRGSQAERPLDTYSTTK